MTVLDTETGKLYDIDISTVHEDEFKLITQTRFWFDWKEEKDYHVFKLKVRGSEDFIGLISLDIIEIESRVEIRLLAVSKENRVKDKKYDKIAGNLIAFACIQAIKHFGEWACISLIPKTELIQYYKKKYSMIPAGRSLFLDGMELIQLIKKYDDD